MIKQTPWEHFLGLLSLFSDTAHIKLEQDNYLLSDDEMNDIQRCINKFGDKHDFFNTITNKRLELIKMITNHGNWDWFLRIVNDVDTNMHNKLISNDYELTSNELQVLKDTFDISGGFSEILLKLIELNS